MKHLRRRIWITGLIAAGLVAVSCSQKPAPLHLNSDECAHCKMMITDPRFAAQIVTVKGKAVKFDAIECLAAYAVQRQSESELQNAKLWVSDFNNPGSWITVDEAVFVKSEEIQSPMGESLLAFGDRAEAESHLKEFPGKLISWNEIKNED